MTDIAAKRFVILHHQLEDSEHCDFMLEYGEALLTWRLPCSPASLDRLPMPAHRIADHRKAYLTYEGPVSQNRGVVRRVDAGVLVILELSDQRCRFELRGIQLHGVFVLERTESGEWTFRHD